MYTEIPPPFFSRSRPALTPLPARSFTVPPRAHPTGSQSGSATPGLTQVPSVLAPGGNSIVAVFVSTPRTPNRRTHRCKFNTARGPQDPLTTAAPRTRKSRRARKAIKAPSASRSSIGGSDPSPDPPCRGHLIERCLHATLRQD